MKQTITYIERPYDFSVYAGPEDESSEPQFVGTVGKNRVSTGAVGEWTARSFGGPIIGTSNTKDDAAKLLLPKEEPSKEVAIYEEPGLIKRIINYLKFDG